MSMPGFSADASLFNPSGRYRLISNNHAPVAAGQVIPQRRRFLFHECHPTSGWCCIMVQDTESGIVSGVCWNS